MKLLVGFITVFFLTTELHSSERPNIVIIYTDDQGYGDVSHINSESKFKTPNIDRLCKEGITFTDCHSSDTVCTPSRYGLLTGRYSWRTTLKRGVFGAEQRCLIEDGRVTIASFLRSEGYHTAAVGKWHLGMDFPGTKGNRDWTKPVKDMPLDKGFDYFWGIPASMNYGILAWFDGRYAMTPPTLYTRKKPNRIAISDYRINSPYEQHPKGTDDLEVAPDFEDNKCLTLFTEKSINWLKSKAQGARKGTPFFLYLPYTSPHKPVIPLKRFRGQGNAGAYGEFMIETDYHIGQILKTLDAERLTENTLIIFTSDNGPENTWKKRTQKHRHQSNGIYREGKRSIYEGGHRVPFIMRWPKKIRPGEQLNLPVCQTDLLATFAEMLGKKLPNDAGEDSNSFYPTILSPIKTVDRLPIIHHSMSGRFAIRHRQWKLVMERRNAKEQRELYDLSKDPRETLNLIKKRPEIAANLFKKINSIILQGRSSPGQPVKNDTPPWSDLVWLKK